MKRVVVLQKYTNCSLISLLNLRTVPTNSKLFLRGLLNMREKQMLTSDIEIQKEIGGNHAFFDDN